MGNDPVNFVDPSGTDAELGNRICESDLGQGLRYFSFIPSDKGFFGPAMFAFTNLSKFWLKKIGGEAALAPLKTFAKVMTGVGVAGTGFDLGCRVGKALTSGGGGTTAGGGGGGGGSAGAW